MRKLLIVVLLTLFRIVAQAQTAPDAAELTKLLNDFLAGASRNDAAMHDRFWADDLIYTRSAGRRVSKADVMRDVRSAPARKPNDPITTYTAEDIRIQQYGETAIVAFRLVGTTQSEGATQVQQFLNSGTFLKRNGKWQVVNWQATRIPRSENESKQEVQSLEAAFQQALLASDLKKLESILAETFVWTHRDGTQMSRKELLDDLKMGSLKYTKLETKNVAITVYGDTAIVRGVSPRQRSSIPSSPGSGDAAPFDLFYTITFINPGGDWKAVAMHSSY